MLISRVYEPTEDEIIYYYCSGDSFHSICSSRLIRLSDLFSMNDFLEIHWGYSIWEKVANELLNEVGKEFLDKIDEVIHSSGIYGLLVATCFSKNGDVLSQWRAYADDGQGYAIGFRAKDILELPIRPLKVLYDISEQIRELKEVIKEIHKVEIIEKNSFNRDFKKVCFLLAYDLASFKNPAFAEEQEIRIIHLLDFQRNNEFLKLVDIGGKAFGKEVTGNPIQYRMKENIPTAFIEEDFTNGGKINPIKEIIIGPKNTVLPSAISIYLETLGIGSVKVKKSKASYR